MHLNVTFVIFYWYSCLGVHMFRYRWMQFHIVSSFGPQPCERLEFCWCLFSQVNAKTLTEVGDPSTAICDAVQKFNINLLVLGERGLGKLKRSVSFHLNFDAMLMCLMMQQNIPTTKWNSKFATHKNVLSGTTSQNWRMVAFQC